MNTKNQQLQKLIAEVLKEAQPRLKEDVYQDFVQKLASQVINIFGTFLGVKARDTAEAERIYSDKELRLFADFLTAIPGAATKSKRLRDFAEFHMTRVFEEAGLGLSDTSWRILLEVFDTAFAVYCGFSKIGYVEFAEKLYESHERKVLANMKSGLIRSGNTQAQNSLNKSIGDILKKSGLGLEDYQERSVQDQMLWLFSDYLQAPEEDKDEVYELGEARVLFSLFDPTKYGEGNKALPLWFE